MKMSKRTDTRDSHAVLLVDATKEEVTRLRKEMPDWHWFREDRLFDFTPKPASHSINAIIVFARKDREKHAIDVCTQICEKKDMETVPLFIAGNRYQMDLVHTVKQLPRVDFIFTPIEKDALLDKMRAKKYVKA
jgi:response regulator RpfG family c-di-GMP phosphodiesterase